MVVWRAVTLNHQQRHTRHSLSWIAHLSQAPMLNSNKLLQIISSSSNNNMPLLLPGRTGGGTGATGPHFLDLHLVQGA